jgi:short-subunit dehydrogenase
MANPALSAGIFFVLSGMSSASHHPTASAHCGTLLITGAGSGIGEATARLYAAEGRPLLLLGRNATRLRELQQELHASTGSEVHTLPGDVRDPDSLIPELRSAALQLGVSDAVINAGIGQYGPVLHSAWTDLDAVLRTNLTGAIATAYAVLPAVAAARGSMVFIGSVLGKRAMPYNAVYSATKWGLQGFADALRLEVSRNGVHVGIVHPARTDTGFFDAMTFSVPQRKRRNVPTAPPSTVALAIRRSMRRRRRETVVSFPGRLFASLGYHFPRLTDILLHYSVPVPESDGNSTVSQADPV